MGIAPRSQRALLQVATGARAVPTIIIVLPVRALFAQESILGTAILRRHVLLREPIGAPEAVVMAGALHLRAPFVLLRLREIVMTLPRALMPVLTGALQAVVAVAGAIVHNAQRAILPT